MHRNNGKLIIIPGEYENLDAAYNVIAYALQHQMESPIGGTAVYPIEVENASQQFQIIKKKFGKVDGRQVFHLLLTYRNNMSEVMDLAIVEAREISNRIGTQFQNVYGFHENTDNLHVHFAINSVNYQTGEKITSEKLLALLEM